MANATARRQRLLLHLLLLSATLSVQAAPAETVTQPPPPALDEAIVEGRAQQGDQEALADDDDLDGRSAYVNNQYVPNDPSELNDEQNAPLYEILQKQMEQVLAATGPDVPIYEDDKAKRQREQQLPNKPLFTHPNNEADDADDDYVDEAASELDQGYTDAEKPDAIVAEEQLPEANGYNFPGMSSSSSARPTDDTSTSSTTPLPPSSSSTASPSSSTTRSRPHRRRTTSSSTTTVLPRTTRGKHSSPTKPSGNSSRPGTANQTETTTAASTNHKQRPLIPSDKPGSSSNPSSYANSLPHEPQIYQHKRRIIFKTISTGSQFVNSPIGDLMIKFSIGFAKPAQALGVPAPTNEALRALSNNLLRNIELQKLKRFKLQKD